MKKPDRYMAMVKIFEVTPDGQGFRFTETKYFEPNTPIHQIFEWWYRHEVNDYRKKGDLKIFPSSVEL